MKKKKKSRSLRYKIMMSAMVPYVITFVIIFSVSFAVVKTAISHEVKSELANVCNIMYNYMDTNYPGEFRKVGSSKIAIYKGDTLLNDNYAVVDMVNRDTEMEATVFYGDLRVITTLKDENGNRAIGTTAPVRVVEDVLKKGTPKFYDNMYLNGVGYYCYYSPVKDKAGDTIGMLYAGKPADKVNSYIWRKLIPIYIVSFLGLLFVAGVIILQMNKVVIVIQKIQGLLKEISHGKLNGLLDSHIYKRDDELSDMENSALMMQRALREMIEKDALTKINNRGFGSKRLAEKIQESDINGVPITVAIGDIDFFKKVNDTYGHACGDDVLVAVADIMKKSMVCKGFVARWGGEEFLLVFDRLNYEESVEMLNEILDRIRATVVRTKEQDICVTMSFGITKRNPGEETRIVLKRADELLYEAKASGRNQVISDKVQQKEDLAEEQSTQD